jgi:capsular exopolysaccharide synthesis family protein
MENNQKTKSIQSILVTNTRSFTDGSSIAADLATLIAQNEKQVVLIDADLRRPIIHTIFNIPNRVGLVDILQDSRPPLSVMHSLHENKLFVLPSGKLPNDAIDFIGSSKMGDLLQFLKGRFDKIIIHGPPFFYTETSSLAAQVDGVVLLIHPGYNKNETSRAIIEKFQKTGATIIGIVMRNQPKNQLNQKVFIDRLLSYDKRARLSP